MVHTQAHVDTHTHAHTQTVLHFNVFHTSYGNTMTWSFLTQLLEEISNHSTFFGKIWLSFYIIFRIVLISLVGGSIYGDEQSNFLCNTMQPSCANVCYNAFAPLSHFHYFTFEIILISVPTIMYLGFAMNKIASINDDEDVTMMPVENRGARTKHDGRRRIKRDGLMKAYVLHLFLRITLEAGFFYGQYILYGFAVIAEYQCTTSPAETL